MCEYKEFQNQNPAVRSDQREKWIGSWWLCRGGKSKNSAISMPALCLNSYPVGARGLASSPPRWSLRLCRHLVFDNAAKQIVHAQQAGAQRGICSQNSHRLNAEKGGWRGYLNSPSCLCVLSLFLFTCERLPTAPYSSESICYTVREIHFCEEFV